MNRITWLTLGLAVGWLVLPHRATAQKEARLIDGEPYDQIVLKEGMQALKLRPLELKVRRPIKNLPADKTLIVRLFDDVKQRYEVSFAAIESVRLFEEMVLDEAARLVENKRFDDAYDFYEYVRERDAEFPGVKEGFQNALFQEALFWKNQGRIDQSLALLNQVHSLNPDLTDLQANMAAAVDTLTGQHLESKDYASARLLLKGLEQRYPDNPVVAKRKQQLVGEAQKHLAAARQAQAEQQMAKAHAEASLAVHWWPALDDARKFLTDIHDQYPVVSVGVRNTTAADLPYPDWVAQRTRRLKHRLLVEAVGVSRDGGRYESPLGKWDTIGDSASIILRKDLAWARAPGQLASYDIARQVVARADPNQRVFHPGWSQLFVSANTPDPLTIEMKLRSPHPLPEAFLQFPITPWFAAKQNGTSAPAIGPYAQGEQTAKTARYVHQKYFAFEDGQPHEIVEQRYTEITAALSALREGEIVALDRIAPWDVPLARHYDQLAVEPYAAPTVHLLVPNLNKPLLAEAAFRRAIAYGIYRQRILEEVLLQREELSELGRLLSGPFPRGYAYNEDVEPLPYNPRMMVALAAAALQTHGFGPAETPTLTLVHPPTETAEAACRAIQRHLQLDGKGLPVRLKRLPAGGKLPTDWDLLYLEWNFVEPLAEVSRLLGPRGLAPGGGVIEENIRRLGAVNSPKEAAQILQSIHEVAAGEQTVIPLWQLQEHLVYRKSLEGISPNPVTLYQSVEKWRHPPVIPKE